MGFEGPQLPLENTQATQATEKVLLSNSLKVNLTYFMPYIQ
ncbi:MAG: hypothetical protein G01um101429_57 [Parcubacteria group bacterium Gr01-1014_29]|nr:MAG: hypothetical protein G01um101429_57 [Parcubacteria group bacterium Gr01-1014_29]